MKRNTAYERAFKSGIGWFNYHGNIALKAGDKVKATLFNEFDEYEVILDKESTFDRWYCKYQGMTYMLDKTIITQIYIDDGYRERRKRTKFHKVVSKRL